MSTVLLPPGGYPIAVNKYIIYYAAHLKSAVNFLVAEIYKINL